MSRWTSSTSKTIISYSSISGFVFNMCKPCEKSVKNNWPKDINGFEYRIMCNGPHQGFCNICQPEQRTFCSNQKY